MKSTRKKPRTISAEAIARFADRGKDVSRFFSNSGKMMPPIQRVNVDFTAIMLNELDAAAKELNIIIAGKRSSRPCSARALIVTISPNPAPDTPWISHLP
jgi:hypothetical protein